jgi:hypothetical protein
MKLINIILFCLLFFTVIQAQPDDKIPTTEIRGLDSTLQAIETELGNKAPTTDLSTTKSSLETKDQNLSDSLRTLYIRLDQLLGTLPQAPLNFQVVSGTLENTLYFSDNGGDTIIAYRSTDGIAFSRLSAVPVSGVNYIKDSSETVAGTTYYYRLTTKNAVTGIESVPTQILNTSWNTTTALTMDFEEGNLSDLWGSTPVQSSLFTTDTNKRHSGLYALRYNSSNAGPGTASDTAWATSTNQISGTRYNIEWWVYLPTGTECNVNSGFLRMFAVAKAGVYGTNPFKVAVGLGSHSSTGLWNKFELFMSKGNYNGTTDTTFTYTPSTFAIRDQWTKFNLEYFIDASNGFARVYINDTLRINVTAKNTNQSEAITDFRFGMVANNNPSIFLTGEYIYFDDLRVEDASTVQASTIYYVDNVLGNDATSSGTGQGGDAFASLEKVNSIAKNPGDQILLKRGQTFRGQIRANTNGTSNLRITYGAYGTGDKPIVRGDTLLNTSWTQRSTGSPLWVRQTSNDPEQLFFNETRGTRVGTITEIDNTNEWTWTSSGSDTIIVYSPSGNPGTVFTSPGISMTVRWRRDGALVSGDYITIKDIQFDRIDSAGVNILSGADNIKVENCDIYQWYNDTTSFTGGIMSRGDYTEVVNCNLGKTTGNDIADENWAGYLGIYVLGANAYIHRNNIYHTSYELKEHIGYTKSTESIGIRLGTNGSRLQGITRCDSNYVYHVGGSGIVSFGYTDAGDTIYVRYNKIRYAGQAGLSAYKTRAFTANNPGGIGICAYNDVQKSNRLGRTAGSNGNRAANIHFNDGSQSTLSTSQRFITWYCFRNIAANAISNGTDPTQYNPAALEYSTVDNTKTPPWRNLTPDGDGIAFDYNAHRVQAYENWIYGNWSKGFYMWNTDSCKFFKNLVWNNGLGGTISCDTVGTWLGNPETTNYNEIISNIFYENTNNNTHSEVLATRAEIYFGQRSTNTKIQNNIIYAPAGGKAYRFLNVLTSGNICNNNWIWSNGGSTSSTIFYNGSNLTFSQWKTATGFDGVSLNSDPAFINAPTDLRPSSTSGINLGVSVPWILDFDGNPIINAPNIGAYEYPLETGS